MARKKTSPPPPPPEPARAAPQKSVINLKGSDEYIAWLEEAHGKTRLSKATLVRLGLELVAKEYRLRTPPEI
jgi:hypothetical protein